MRPEEWSVAYNGEEQKKVLVQHKKTNSLVSCHFCNRVVPGTVCTWEFPGTPWLTVEPKTFVLCDDCLMETSL